MAPSVGGCQTARRRVSQRRADTHPTGPRPLTSGRAFRGRRPPRRSQSPTPARGRDLPRPSHGIRSPGVPDARGHGHRCGTDMVRGLLDDTGVSSKRNNCTAAPWPSRKPGIPGDPASSPLSISIWGIFSPPWTVFRKPPKRGRRASSRPTKRFASIEIISAR